MRTSGEYGAAADAGRTRAQIRLSPFPESLAARMQPGITRDNATLLGVFRRLAVPIWPPAP